MSSTDNQMRDIVQNAVRQLMKVSNTTTNTMTAKQCQAIGETIGTMMAPQLYGNRIHGVGNAISTVIRCCAEVLFWLDLDDSGVHSVETAKTAIIELRDFLASPSSHSLSD